MDEANPSYTKIMAYIERNPAAVLSTIGEDGPHGAVVYTIPASHGTLCFVTKNQTKKYQDIVNNGAVSLTYYNDNESTTLQVTGNAYVADDSQGLQTIVMDKMTKAHATQSSWLPPVTKITSGEYAVIGVEVKYARLSDYGTLDVGGPTITELK